MQPLGLQMLAHLLKEGHLDGQVVLNLPHGLFLRLLAGHEEVCRVHIILLVCVDAHHADGVHLLDALNLVAPIHYSQQVVAIGQRNVHRIALHTHLATAQTDVVAHIKALHQPTQQLVAVQLHTHLQMNHILVEGRGISHTIDAGHTAHHNHVSPAAQQRTGGRQTQFVNLVIDGQVLLDVGVCAGNIGFGLVIVVVTHIVLHSIVREELLHLAVELGGQRLVMAQNQCGLAALRNHVGHSEGLSASGHA